MKAKFMSGYKMDAFSGLFMYSAFGRGTLYLENPETGLLEKHHTGTSEAADMCREWGVEFKYRDSFDGYKATYVGD